MLAFALRRFVLAIAVALTVSIIAFLMLRISGDAATAMAGEGANEATINAIRETYGLNRPLSVQYASWLWNALHGDFGQSIYFKTDVLALVAVKIPATLKLALLSLLVAVVLSLPLGVFAAVYSGSLIDRIASAIALLGQVMPVFFLALTMIMVFAVQLRWLPVSGSTSWAHFVMPSFVLGYYITPPLMRLVRAGMIEALSMDYVRTARAKGLPLRMVIIKHALRNAVVPVVSLATVQLGLLLGGSVVIESIFALDGLGYLAYQSISYKDFPVLQCVLLLLSLSYVMLNFMGDLANMWLDPRLRTEPA